MHRARALMSSTDESRHGTTHLCTLEEEAGESKVQVLGYVMNWREALTNETLLKRKPKLKNIHTKYEKHILKCIIVTWF